MFRDDRLFWIIAAVLGFLVGLGVIIEEFPSLDWTGSTSETSK